MPLTTLPTKVDQPSATGIGRVKSDHPDHPVEDLDFDYPAAEHEKIKDYAIDIAGEVGIHVGTAGSLNVRTDALETSVTALGASVTALQVDATAPADVTKAAASAGASTHAARRDHKHDVSTAVAGAIAVGDSAAEGSATSLARSDHRHSFASPSAPADVTKAAASAGASSNVARQDHKHDVSTAAPVASLNAKANAEGSATSLARSDHTHRLALAIVAVNGGVTLGATDGVLVVDTSVVRNIQLPSPAGLSGQLPVLIIDKDGTSTSAGIVLLLAGSEKIDNSSSNRTLAYSFGRWWLFTNGTDWFTAEMGSTLSTPVTPSGLEAGVSSAIGSFHTPARGDHTHAVPTTAPADFPNSTRLSIEGNSANFARSDHEHDYANAIYNTITASGALGDHDITLVDTSGGAVVLTLPSAPGYGIGMRLYVIKKITTDANKITLDPPGSEVIEGGAGGANFDLPNSTASTRPSWTLAFNADDNLWWIL
jgi:hypothetical protein